jgi:hypothetical protein
MVSIAGKLQAKFVFGTFGKWRLQSQEILAITSVMDTPNSLAVKAAVTAAGGRRMLADALGISAEAIRQWDEIPVKRLAKVSEVTGIPKPQLRPDIFGEAQQ